MEKYIEWRFYSYTLLQRLLSCCQCEGLEGLWAPHMSVRARMGVRKGISEYTVRCLRVYVCNSSVLGLVCRVCAFS